MGASFVMKQISPRVAVAALAAVLLLPDPSHANRFRPKACAPQDLAEFFAAIDAACPCGAAMRRSDYRACARRVARERMKAANRTILRVCNKTALRCAGRSTCGMSQAVTCSRGQHVACVYTGACTDDRSVPCTGNADCIGTCDFTGVPGGVCADDPGETCLNAKDCGSRSCEVKDKAGACDGEVGVGTCCVFD